MKFCADCSNYDTKKKKAEGLCECKKLKSYLPGNTPACDKFSQDYSRTWYEKEKLCDDGRKVSNSWSDTNISIIIPIILIIIVLILKLINFI